MSATPVKCVCGAEARRTNAMGEHWVLCCNSLCRWHGPTRPTEAEAVAAWNAVMGASAELAETRRQLARARANGMRLLARFYGSEAGHYIGKPRYARLFKRNRRAARLCWHWWNKLERECET